MQYFEKQGNALIFRQDGETVRVEPWQKDSLRVRGTLLSEIEEGSIALLDPEPVEAEIELVDELKATIKNGKIQAVLELQPWGQKLRITFLNQKGEVLLSEIANGGALCLRAHDYRALKGGAYQLKVSFDSNPDEKIYGMGQYQQERMNLKGCNLELAHRNSQASIPFYVSSLGYGFLWHNAAVGEVHFGTNTTEWLARTTKQLDYWVTAGDTPAEIEEHFADAIGKVPMMPEYGLGFWQCKLRYYNQEQVLNVAREYKKRGIPLDVFVIDYYHWPRCGDYRFDEEYFPDPKAMIDELHEMGIETMVSIWPQIDWRSENYEEMKQQGLLVKSNAGVDVQMLFHGNNVFLDATNPRTRKYVWEKVKKNFIIKKAIDEAFREGIGKRIEKYMDVEYVYQELDVLPKGYEVPEGRVKPWGTGHAILCAAEAIDGAPFAVINSDDYYGRTAFEEIYRQLTTEQDGATYQYAMVAYDLYKTLTDNGHVARGICTADDQNHLVGIHERTRIENHGGQAEYTEDDGATWTGLPQGTIVSMNLWGFTPSILIELKRRFLPFLENVYKTNPLKGEYFLPFVVDELLQEKKAEVTVLRSYDNWYGVTYKEDKENVMAALQKLKDEGRYPQKLWEE